MAFPKIFPSTPIQCLSPSPSDARIILNIPKLAVMPPPPSSKSNSTTKATAFNSTVLLIPSKVTKRKSIFLLPTKSLILGWYESGESSIISAPKVVSPVIKSKDEEEKEETD